MFVLFVIVADIAAVDAQIVLKGKVTTREEEPVAFAAVSLRGMRDTTRLVETAVTDMQGNYAFGKHREGKYLLTIQSLGFRTLNDTVHIRRSSLGNTYEMRKDYLLEEEATAIDDVVVVGTNVTHYPLNIFSEIPFYRLSLYISYLQMFSFGLNTHEISLF